MKNLYNVDEEQRITNNCKKLHCIWKETFNVAHV